MLSIQSEVISLCASNGKSMTKTSIGVNVIILVFRATIGVNVIILFFRAPAHMLSTSMTIFLYDALKQTESMLNVPKE